MPSLSVVILNYNGNEVVLPCLRGIFSLGWSDAEVVVVDNASTDGSPDEIAKEFGDRVRLIRRTVNSPTAGRNQGYRAALGEYILSLDNDMLLSDPGIPWKAAAILEQYPNVGALAFKIGSLDRPNEPLAEHWWHPVGLKEGHNQCFYTDWFAEGAIIFRRSAMLATGGYDEDLFHGFESADLALRLLERKIDILYCPSLACVELRVRGMQYMVRQRMNYLVLRNKLWTAWKDYPLGRGLYFAVTRTAAGGLRALRHGWMDLWFRAVVEGIAAPRVIRKKRNPLPRRTWKHIRGIRKGRFCLEVWEDDAACG
jgi:glycosyltransferase involved in cell wall biosynthesis